MWGTAGQETRSGTVERGGQRLESPSAVRHLVLLIVRHLGVCAVPDGEDRVVSEPAPTPALIGDRSFNDTLNDDRIGSGDDKGNRRPESS